MEGGEEDVRIYPIEAVNPKDIKEGPLPGVMDLLLERSCAHADIALCGDSWIVASDSAGK